MSFLSQLKSQASALQSEQREQQSFDEANTRLTDAAAKTAWLYLADLVKQLNVIEPAAPALSLDGKTPWPPMKLLDFRIDARKKKLHDQEVFDYVAVGWRIVPRTGEPVSGSVSANFPPDLQRIEARLAAGSVQHERVNVRHPDKNTLQAIRFDYLTEARGGVSISTDHQSAKLVFRLAALRGFEIVSTTYRADHLQSPLLDELAKLMVGQTSNFI